MPAEDSRLEPAGVSTRAVLVTVFGFLAFAAATGAGLVLYYRINTGGRPNPPETDFPLPRLQTAPRVDLEAARRQAWLRLGGYGWVDREAGVVRVPIDHAMAAVVARGAAGFDPVDGGPTRIPSPARDAPDRPAGATPR